MGTHSMRYVCPHCNDQRQVEVWCDCQQNSWIIVPTRRFGGGFYEDKGLICTKCKSGYKTWACQACRRQIPVIPTHVKLKNENAYQRRAYERHFGPDPDWVETAAPSAMPPANKGVCVHCGGVGRTVCGACGGYGYHEDRRTDYDPVRQTYTPTIERVHCYSCVGGYVTCSGCGGMR